eukprot:TRINITY_DN941_c0_g3_i1.p1 TRINITY_DN941_c0_g3~~TRINITY_DN941_c0_g3_i1.p1  ORF type:complete len:248 (+),score=41.49 TRINITY_DN941_c0_g3_i1:34-744(+)
MSHHDKPLQDALKQMKQDLKVKALDVIKNFPVKCTEITKILESDNFSLEPSKVRETIDTFDPEAEGRAKKRKIDEITSQTVSSDPVSLKHVPLNMVINKIKPILKKEFQQFIESISIIRLWIQLNVPRIEDGNNFGVQVQEDLLGEVIKAEDHGFGSLDIITRYHPERSRLIAKCLKHPRVEDFSEGVGEVDQKFYYEMVVSLRDLRNIYATLFDLIQKNYDKIIKPRSDHAQSLL